MGSNDQIYIKFKETPMFASMVEGRPFFQMIAKDTRYEFIERLISMI